MQEGLRHTRCAAQPFSSGPPGVGGSRLRGNDGGRLLLVRPDRREVEVAAVVVDGHLDALDVVADDGVGVLRVERRRVDVLHREVLLHLPRDVHALFDGGRCSQAYEELVHIRVVVLRFGGSVRADARYG